MRSKAVASRPSTADVRRHLSDMLTELADLADAPGDPNLTLLASQLRKLAQEAAAASPKGLPH